MALRRWRSRNDEEIMHECNICKGSEEREARARLKLPPLCANTTEKARLLFRLDVKCACVGPFCRANAKYSKRNTHTPCMLPLTKKLGHSPVG
eukprot:2136178-Pleurochrysis_carterae.AAC.4